jgi:hypothetical protein
VAKFCCEAGAAQSFFYKQDAQTAQSRVHAPSMINKLLRSKYQKLATAALKSSVEG